MVSPQSLRHYFVDEGGDGTLFAKGGRLLLETGVCSRFFILGLLDVPDPDALTAELEQLRTRLLDDPYFKDVPSMQPQASKTAVAFHAKDDLPEIRREVFSLLRSHEGLRFFAVIRDKRSLLEYVRGRNQSDPSYRYHPNELYDYLVRILFRDRLHKEDEYRISFAKRGKSDRTAALRDALEGARRNFAKRWQITSGAQIHVIPTTPPREPCLQAADYFVWALQRLFERNEDRYLTALWPACHTIMDLDDTREKHYGVYYTKRKPLDRAAIEGRL